MDRSRRTVAPRACLGLALLGLALATGCMPALMQTGRTAPAGQVNLSVGNNLAVRETGTSEQPLLGGYQDLHVGLTERIEVSADSFVGGGKVNGKVALLPRDVDWAFAVHGGVGVVLPQDGRSLSPGAELGVVGSYHGFGPFVPYAGLRWLNLWTREANAPAAPTSPNVLRPRPDGYGNGALVPALGVYVGGSRAGAFFEYSVTLPVTSDVNDGWAFVTTHLFNVAFNVCMTKSCKF